MVLAPGPGLAVPPLSPKGSCSRPGAGLEGDLWGGMLSEGSSPRPPRGLKFKARVKGRLQPEAGLGSGERGPGFSLRGQQWNSVLSICPVAAHGWAAAGDQNQPHQMSCRSQVSEGLSVWSRWRVGTRGSI